MEKLNSDKIRSAEQLHAFFYAPNCREFFVRETIRQFKTMKIPADVSTFFVLGQTTYILKGKESIVKGPTSELLHVGDIEECLEGELTHTYLFLLFLFLNYF